MTARVRADRAHVPRSNQSTILICKQRNGLANNARAINLVMSNLILRIIFVRHYGHWRRGAARATVGERLPSEGDPPIGFKPLPGKKRRSTLFFRRSQINKHGLFTGSAGRIIGPVSSWPKGAAHDTKRNLQVSEI